MCFSMKLNLQQRLVQQNWSSALRKQNRCFQTNKQTLNQSAADDDSD